MIARTRWRFESSGAPDRLREASDEMESLLAVHGVSERGRFAARLVCEELVLNALEHGKARSVSLQVDPDRDPRQLLFEDDGIPFDPTVPASPPDATGTRGRGLVLVQRFAAALAYRRDGGANRLEVQLPD
ncbi:MAG TPA: ATP-binding protein [Candidatus Sulfotelmatobacter sp.]|nr:ATP-binding protein [Candidatus Sulfotelmatobacter sp.]